MAEAISTKINAHTLLRCSARVDEIQGKFTQDFQIISREEQMKLSFG